MLAAAGSERINDVLRCEDEDGEKFDTTGLIQSSWKGQMKVVELLIGAKADVNKCNKVNLHFYRAGW